KRPGGQLSSRRLLCRSHPAWREGGRSPGAVADQVRDGREPQDRHGARPCDTPVDNAARGSGDRVKGSCAKGSLLRQNIGSVAFSAPGGHVSSLIYPTEGTMTKLILASATLLAFFAPNSVMAQGVTPQCIEGVYTLEEFKRDGQVFT